MRIQLLGTAAGGGFPQWNCRCRNCAEARTNPAAAHPRTQSSVAVSADGQRWFLLNASPDIAAQIAAFPPLQPARVPVRGTPIQAVLLTNADLDHSLGVLCLRENAVLSLYASAETRSDLSQGVGLLPVLDVFCGVKWSCASATEEPLLYADGSASSLVYSALPVPSKPPRFSRRGLDGAAPGGSVAYRIRDTRTGGSLIYAPDVMELSGELTAFLNECDLLLFDGTLWSETEMQEQQISQVTARDMGHLPISGPRGSLNGLRGLSRPAKVYIHINNTNPILLEHSPERAQVRAAGWTVGEDGTAFTI
jgi:pyrroloquinoline quinone biosynthesis protein B